VHKVGNKIESQHNYLLFKHSSFMHKTASKIT